MTHRIHSQMHALDRVLHLLEERSFQTLALDNEHFAEFIEQLYKQVDSERKTIAS